MYKSKVARIFVTLFFIGLLFVPVALKNLDTWNNDDSNQNRESALARYGFFLEDYTDRAGVEFVHRAPELDPKLNHIMPQVASVGASVSVVDFNNDGWQDFYLTNSARNTQNALYRNNGDGTFTDVAGQLGVASLNTDSSGTSMGSVWGDFNNDGYEDLFVYKWGKPVLFRNEAGKRFTRISKMAGMPDWVNANAAVWLDFDRDGRLDLFLGGYYDEKYNLWNLETTKIMPESFEYAGNGGRNYLFHNLGDGRFEEVGEEMGIVSSRWALSAASVDLDGSGYPDLVVANDYGVDELYLNREGMYFENKGVDAGMGFAPKSGMNVSFGDILNTGSFAIYITNISEPGVLIQGNNLWLPVSGTGEKAIRYENMAGNLGVELGGWSYGGQFGDLNNDGFIDLYVANGYVSAEKGTDYWYDFSKVAGGHKNIISDAQNWPAMEGRSLSGYQENRIWINDGAGKFQEVANAVGGSLRLDSRAVAFADLWNRGVLDIIVATQRGPVKIYRNNVTDDHTWLEFKLKGTESNRSAIGTKVMVHFNGNTQVQQVMGGSGYGSQNQRPLHFGLGPDPEIQKVEIHWPSGQVQSLENIDINKTHTLTEPRK